MSRTLRVCALQLAAHDRSAFESGSVSFNDVVRAAAGNADLLVLPEGTFPAYVLGEGSIDGGAVRKAIEELGSIAVETQCVIVAGAAIEREGSLFNSAVVIDADGSIAGSAEKIFLWHFDRKWFAPGKSLQPIDTRAGRLGVMICADGRMPGIAQTLVDRGAQILVMPTAWVTSGRNPDELENIQADLLARVRAFENGVPFVAANKCGAEMGMVAYCGKSQIVDAHGAVVVIAPQHEPGKIEADLTLSSAQPRREQTPAIARRTPPEGAQRVAVSMDEPSPDVARRLAIIDASELLTPSSSECIDAALAYDPRTLVAYRAAGHRRILLRADRSDDRLEMIARARAAELRLYVIVFDAQRDRAYAVDPDGTVIAGTFGAFRIASVPIDYRRTSETSVAPGTDVAAGLAAVQSIAAEVQL